METVDQNLSPEERVLRQIEDLFCHAPNGESGPEYKEAIKAYEKAKVCLEFHSIAAKDDIVWSAPDGISQDHLKIVLAVELVMSYCDGENSDKVRQGIFEALLLLDPTDRQHLAMSVAASRDIVNAKHGSASKFYGLTVASDYGAFRVFLVLSNIYANDEDPDFRKKAILTAADIVKMAMSSSHYRQSTPSSAPTLEDIVKSIELLFKSAEPVLKHSSIPSQQTASDDKISTTQDLPKKPEKGFADFSRLLPRKPEDDRIVIYSPRSIVARGSSSLHGNDFLEFKKELAEPKLLKLKDIGLVDEAFSRLHTDFPWFQSLIEQLYKEVRINASRLGYVKFRPILLVGSSGIGKTKFASRLAKSLDLGYERVDRGGETDNRDFAGTSKGWSSATPSAPVLLIHRTGKANPIMFVDELDKETVDARNGSAAQTLLAMLEPETSSSWKDPCLADMVNLSYINWIIGVNSELALNGPLLTRVAIYDLSGPGPEHFDALLKSILADLLPRFGEEFDDEHPALFPELIEILRKQFKSKHLTPRAMVKKVESALSANYNAITQGFLN